MKRQPKTEKLQNRDIPAKPGGENTTSDTPSCFSGSSNIISITAMMKRK
jgi:hypothetical protein